MRITILFQDVEVVSKGLYFLILSAWDIFLALLLLKDGAFDFFQLQFSSPEFWFRRVTLVGESLLHVVFLLLMMGKVFYVFKVESTAETAK